MTLDGMKDGGAPVDIVIEMRPEWAPIGAAHFRDLVDAGFYDGARFFRVLGDFIAQCGLDSQNDGLLVGDMADTLVDDPSVKGVTNSRCTLTYATAGPNTRDHQFFINYADNSFLDSQGFTAFGTIISGCDEAIAGIAEVGEVISQGDLTTDSSGAITAYETSSGQTVSYIATATSTDDDAVVAEDSVVAEMEMSSTITSTAAKSSTGSMVVVGIAMSVFVLASALVAVRQLRAKSAPKDNTEAPCVPSSSSLDDFPSTII
jgi:cyclophilin family peptidyl-prolyl cis-trans isomerase